MQLSVPCNGYLYLYWPRIMSSAPDHLGEIYLRNNLSHIILLNVSSKEQADYCLLDFYFYFYTHIGMSYSFIVKIRTGILQHQSVKDHISIFIFILICMVVIRTYNIIYVLCYKQFDKFIGHRLPIFPNSIKGLRFRTKWIGMFCQTPNTL